MTDASTLQYAQKMIHRGYGLQNAARISGMAEADLRDFVGGRPPRPERPAPAVCRYERPQEPMTPCMPTLAAIREVAARYDMTADDLIGPLYCRPYAQARHEAMYAVRSRRPHLSLPMIGRIFGGRDHTTVLYGIRRHEARVLWGEILREASRGEPIQPDLFAVAA